MTLEVQLSYTHIDAAEAVDNRLGDQAGSDYDQQLALFQQAMSEPGGAAVGLVLGCRPLLVSSRVRSAFSDNSC